MGKVQIHISDIWHVTTLSKDYNIIIIIIIIITMAQQPYMGPGLLLPSRLLSRAHSWQLVTGQLAGSQETWVRNGGTLAYATFLFMPVRFFYMP
jgi:hypothetical protein